MQKRLRLIAAIARGLAMLQCGPVDVFEKLVIFSGTFGLIGLISWSNP